MRKLLIFFLAIIFFFITLNQTGTATVTKQAGNLNTDNSKLITDIKNWNHPVKKVMTNNKITIKKVQLISNNKYPVFYVQFPFNLKYGNKDYFDKVELEIAKANSFWDYKMIDENKKISIEVICDKTFKVVKHAVINGKANYFMMLEQEEAIKNYHYIKPISVKSISPILMKIILSGWDSKFEKILSKPDSFFDDYFIYFNKGIKVDSRLAVFNIVLNDKYNEKVVNDISMKSSKTEIVKSLGYPQFVSSDDNVFGYKTDKFYIFFFGKDKIKEVSIYRRDSNYDKTMLKKIINGLGNETLWEKYEYLSNNWAFYDSIYNSRGGMGIQYYSSGIFLSNDNEFDDNLPVLRIYSNYEGDITDTISLPGKINQLSSFKNDFVLLELDKDSVFEYEKSRVKYNKQIEQSRIKEGVLSPDGTKRAMENNGGTYEHAGIFILSVNKDKPDVEFGTPHFPYKIQWLTNRYLLYEVSMNGIYVYDTVKNQAIEVSERKNFDDLVDYELVSVKNGQIVYKDTENNQTISKKFSFNKDGSIVFDKR